MDDPAEAAYEKGVELLARREHGAEELQAKLTRKGYEPEAVRDALGRLVEQGYLSDGRFAEAFARQRIERGQGPVRIRAELGQRGIDDALAERAMAAHAPDWAAMAREARAHRFGDDPPASAKDRARQLRFLAQRGFTAEQARAALGGTEDD